MNVSKQKIFILLAVLIWVGLLSVGCSATKSAKPLTATPKEVANLVETEADKVEGVRKATALVADKNIYIGLELKEKRDEQQSISIEQSVMDRVINLEPNYNIGVSSDMGIVGKIKEVSMGFEQGKPLSNFSSEIMQIDQGTKLKKEALDKQTGRPSLH